MCCHSLGSMCDPRLLLIKWLTSGSPFANFNGDKLFQTFQILPDRMDLIVSDCVIYKAIINLFTAVIVATELTTVELTK